MIKRTVLFIVGMGRSGTSALTRVLSLSGAELPDELLGPAPSNERGHWEPSRALKINETFLSENGSSWYDPSLRLQNEDCIPDAAEQAFVSKVKNFFSSCPEAPLLVIKEPRIAALSKYWLRAADELAIDRHFIIPVRRPSEVIGSLTSRPYLCTPELSASLWIKYNLLAERCSRGKSRVFIDYNRLLKDWRREVGRAAYTLSVNLHARGNGEVESFLEKGLNHHSQALPSSGGLSSVCNELYQHLSLAAQGGRIEDTAFDHHYEQYSSSERFFRTALADFAARS